MPSTLLESRVKYNKRYWPGLLTAVSGKVTTYLFPEERFAVNVGELETDVPDEVSLSDDEGGEVTSESIVRYT